MIMRQENQKQETIPEISDVLRFAKSRLPLPKTVHEETGLSWESIATVFSVTRNTIIANQDRAAFLDRMSANDLIVRYQWEVDSACGQLMSSHRNKAAAIKKSWQERRTEYYAALKLREMERGNLESQEDGPILKRDCKEYDLENSPIQAGEHYVAEEEAEIVAKAEAYLIETVAPAFYNLDPALQLRIGYYYEGYAALGYFRVLAGLCVMTAQEKEWLKAKIFGMSDNAKGQMFRILRNAKYIPPCESIRNQRNIKYHGNVQAGKHFEESVKEAGYSYNLIMVALICTGWIHLIEDEENTDLLIAYAFGLTFEQQSEIVSDIKQIIAAKDLSELQEAGQIINDLMETEDVPCYLEALLGVPNTLVV